MRQVRFRFNPDKLVHAVAFFANHGINDLTKLKAAKLIYFLDKLHLWEHGRPVIGGPYFCMPFGPVPGKALSTLNDVIDGGEVEAPFAGPSHDLIEKYLTVDSGGEHPRFVAKQNFDPDVFSGSELAALETTFKNYGHRTAGQLVQLTHEDPTWTIPNEQRVPGRRVDIPYHLFFENAPAKVREIWGLIEAEQEDRDSDDLFDPETLQILQVAD